MKISRDLQEPLIEQQHDEETCSDENDNEIVPAEGKAILDRYRWTTIIVAVLDLLATISMFALLFKQVNNNSLQSSVVDIAGLAVARTILLTFQASRFISLQATKVSGYVSLLSLLFVVTKISVSDHDRRLYTVLLLVGLAFCAVECLCTVLVGLYSSKDLSTSVAPTADEAAEGISTEGKTIGLFELFKVLIPYFWPNGVINRICVCFTWIFLMLSKASNILAPLYIAKATDALSNNNNFSTTVWNIIIYAGLLLSNKVFKEAQALSYIRVKLIAGVQLKEKIFTHLLSLSMDWHQRKSMGAVVTAMQRGITASNMVVQYLFLYLLPTLIEAVIVAGVFVKAFQAPLLAACAVSGCTLYTAVTVELTIFRMQFRRKMNKAENDASHKVTESLLNIETVKYASTEEHEIQRYRESVDVSKDQAYKIQGSLSILNTSQQIVLNCTLVAALLIAAHECREGRFTVGQFVAVNIYVMQLFAPLNFLGTIYGMAVGSYVDLQNLCNMLAERPEIQDREGAKTLTVLPHIPLGIEFCNVTFAYPSRKEVSILKGVDIVVPPGSTTAVVGGSGSGKSTLTRLLFRLYEADEGQVLVGGHNVLELTQKSLRRQLGVVPQDHILFNDTLDYNISYGADTQDREAVQRAARAAELDDFIAGLPKGFDTVVGERGQQVSGGQKQRIAIARVLMKTTPIVVLDEATSSLDSRTEELVQKALDNLRGRTMLIIAHRLSTIQNADQIIVLSNGEVLETGTHEMLLTKGTWHERCYASLWERQKKAD
eukprot:CAMPEP_0194204940 /NCGR_PEP_ID=MMETSP0156-20130528/4332_1 /TAXON_ID=33649 /ORGANISM="Thalassionema nitzschioides, Strain L26-B" /LENGTH=772 /DNA_ID=CAMNT_0038931085 /DNA_START=65 /DNA_END=2383 /DNA_ORIENTATION=+